MAGPRDHPRAPEQIDQLPRSDGRPGRPDRPRVPDSPARTDRPDTQTSARADRPDAGPPADGAAYAAARAPAADERRTRALEALPPGHPSSPYSPDGSRRESRPDLRSLELPLPGDPARSDVPGHDADARFKQPVPKPEGYLPDDTGGSGPTRVAPREPAGRDAWPPAAWDTWTADPAAGARLAERDDRTTAPHPQEGADGERADTPRAVVDRPAFHDPTDDRPPDRYGDPLSRPDGTRVPCFDGPPRREQTRQGWAGDCGIIATLGAVAAHRPEDITRRIHPQEDGSCQVTLSETRESRGVTEPTGREVELTVTPDVPVYDDDPGSPACAKTQDGAAWCAMMEKAFAGVDQTWVPVRRADWAAEWAGLCARDRDDDVAKPRSGPPATGYVRLHQGTTPWERAEALTQLTGQPAVVREFPAGRDEWEINRDIRAQLAASKPVLVSSRKQAHKREVLPHDLKPAHVYEVVGIEKGKIVLRNPWNENHPQPMETDEFAHNVSRYYSTLM